MRNLPLLNFTEKSSLPCKNLFFISYVLALRSAVKWICLPFQRGLQSNWPVQRGVGSPGPQPFVHMSALLSHMLTGHNCYCNAAGRITSAACVLRHWFTIEESYGDSHWLIGLLFLTQVSVSQILPIVTGPGFIRGLSLPHFYSFLLSLSLSPEFLLCPAHVCVIAVITGPPLPPVSNQYRVTQIHPNAEIKSWTETIFCCICCWIQCPNGHMNSHTHTRG